MELSLALKCLLGQSLCPVLDDIVRLTSPCLSHVAGGRAQGGGLANH